MQLPLFKALKSINVGDEEATDVVTELEAYMASRMKEATAGLESKVDAYRSGVESQLKGLESKIDATRTQITFIGAMLALIGLALAASPIIAAMIK